MSTVANENEAELQNENLSKFHRAAEISMYVKCATIGPTCHIVNNEEVINNDENKENERSKSSPRRNNENGLHQQVVENFSKMDINDLKSFQFQMEEQNRKKIIENEVKKKLEEKIAEEMKNYAKIQSNIEKMKQEAEKKHQLKMQEFARQIQLELEKESQKELIYQEQKKALAANTKKIQEEKERQLKEQVRKFEEVFLKQEAAFMKIIQSCNPEMGPALDSFKKQLMDIKNFKDTQKGSMEVTKSACIKLDGLCQALQREIREFKAAYQAKKAQKEAEQQKLAAAAAAAEVIVPKQIVAVQPRSQDQLDRVPAEQSNAINNELFKAYNEYRQLLMSKKEQTKRLDEAPELQQLRFALKYAINNPINLLNEMNKTTLLDGYQKLFNILSGQRVNTPKGAVSIADHNEAPDWCRLRIAEKLIDRCDKEPTIVYYTGALTIALWQKFPEFGDIFKASLYIECPFLIPFKPPKLKSQTNEEFLQSWGFKASNGVFEKLDLYEKRTSKFASLLGALWITYSRKGENEVTPFDIRHGWIYFANILNTRPDTSTLHIIWSLLETCGFMLHQYYGKAFVKLMLIFRDQYIPAVHSLVDEETSAAFNRLQDAVGKFFTENKFTEPKGRIKNGYW